MNREFTPAIGLQAIAVDDQAAEAAKGRREADEAARAAGIDREMAGRIAHRIMLEPFAAAFGIDELTDKTKVFLDGLIAEAEERKTK